MGAQGVHGGTNGGAGAEAHPASSSESAAEPNATEHRDLSTYFDFF